MFLRRFTVGVRVHARLCGNCQLATVANRDAEAAYAAHDGSAHEEQRGDGSTVLVLSHNAYARITKACPSMTRSAP